MKVKWNIETKNRARRTTRTLCRSRCSRVSVGANIRTNTGREKTRMFHLVLSSPRAYPVSSRKDSSRKGNPFSARHILDKDLTRQCGGQRDTFWTSARARRHLKYTEPMKLTFCFPVVCNFVTLVLSLPHSRLDFTLCHFHSFLQSFLLVHAPSYFLYHSLSRNNLSFLSSHSFLALLVFAPLLLCTDCELPINDKLRSNLRYDSVYLIPGVPRKKRNVEDSHSLPVLCASCPRVLNEIT